MNVECIIPILKVRDLGVSVEFYTRTLGFKLDWEMKDEMASVSHDGHALMLCQGQQGQPGTWVWIGVEEIESVHAACIAKGAPVRLAPTNRPWAYEMQIEDPDGHVLRFGCERKMTTDRKAQLTGGQKWGAL